jgi:hypothetical protein
MDLGCLGTKGSDFGINAVGCSWSPEKVVSMTLVVTQLSVFDAFDYTSDV